MSGRQSTRARHVAALERSAVEEARIALDDGAPSLPPALSGMARFLDRHGWLPHMQQWPAGIETAPRYVPVELYMPGARRAANVLDVWAVHIWHVETGVSS
jgi:hypothetical protein